ncbi:MAG TPA: tRNA pseudouridine(13) synthase TruD, partial [Phycisphaerales bacterium]|nr:tRNA pseudouridine(13) synthase TruD [Phycisphaerales bacterium]
AFQSAVFNSVLTRRLGAGTFGALAEGDLAMKHDNGAVFAVDRAVLDTPTTPGRLARLEISPSGPMWGPRMTLAQGEAARVEHEELARTGVTMDHLAKAMDRKGEGLGGARRAMRVPLGLPEVEGGADEHGEYVRCAFELPPGAFATVVMREVMKTEAFTAETQRTQRQEEEEEI